MAKDADLYRYNYGKSVFAAYSGMIDEFLRKIMLLERCCHGCELILDETCGRYYLCRRGYDRDKEIEIRNKIKETTEVFHKKHPDVVKSNCFDWAWYPEPLYYID